MDSHGFRITNRCLPDLLRAMTATEARSITSGVVTDGAGCFLLAGADVWLCEPVGDDYKVTLPDGREGTGTTVANALAAAKASA